jgi:hypothetical protein
MEEEVMLNDHERRIVNLEHGQEAIQKQQEITQQQIIDLSNEVSAGNTKAEKDNTYLREQNDKMFQTIIEINTRTQDRKHELKLIDKQNWWKLILGIGGSLGVVYSILQALLDQFAK